MGISERLRQEANAAERLAEAISFEPHREQLRQQAKALRLQAERLEQRSWRPGEHPDDPDSTTHH